MRTEMHKPTIDTTDAPDEIAAKLSADPKTRAYLARVLRLPKDDREKLARLFDSASRRLSVPLFPRI